MIAQIGKPGSVELGAESAVCRGNQRERRGEYAQREEFPHKVRLGARKPGYWRFASQ